MGTLKHESKRYMGRSRQHPGTSYPYRLNSGDPVFVMEISAKTALVVPIRCVTETGREEFMLKFRVKLTDLRTW